MLTPPVREKMIEIAARHGAGNLELFGSAARGELRPDSDIDLLVVVKCDRDTRAKLIEIRRALADLPVAKDVIVVTPEYFARYRDVVGTVVWPATHEGRVLYERAA